MKIAFSTRPFSDRALTEAIRTLGAVGFDGVDVVADFPHLLPAHVTPAVLDLVKTAALESRVKLSALETLTMTADPRAPGPSWIDPDPAVRLERFRYTIDCIRMAGVLGAAYVVTPGGGAWSGGDGASQGRAYDLLEQGLRRATPVAEEFGVTILVEAGPGFLVETNRQLRHLLGRLQHASLRASLNVGHAFCVGEDPAEVVRDLGPWLRYLHVADVPATREHLHLVPGRGAIDFASLGASLREQRYRGYLSVDVSDYDDTPDVAARESLEALRARL